MGVTERTERTDDELREQAIGMALDSFFTIGYSQTSANQIAKDLGISKKTLYKIFPSKEDLLRAVTRSVMTAIEELTDRIYADHDRSVPERVASLVSQIAPHYARIRSARILEDLQRNAPAIWAELDAWRQYRYTRFKAIIEDGIAQGSVRSELEIHEILAVYSVVVNKCMDHAALEDTDVTSLELYRGSMDVFFRGIFVSSIHPSVELGKTVEFGQREGLLLHAEQLFFERGFAKTTTDSIAKASGISKRTLYERFPKKSDLAMAVLLRAAHDVRGLIGTLRYSDRETFESEFQTLIMGCTSALGRVSTQFLNDLAASAPIGYKRIVRWRRRFLSRELRRALEEGQKHGMIRHDLHVPSTVLILSIMIENLLLPDARANAVNVIPPPISVVCSVILFGISPRTTLSRQQQTH